MAWDIGAFEYVEEGGAPEGGAPEKAPRGQGGR